MAGFLSHSIYTSSIKHNSQLRVQCLKEFRNNLWETMIDQQDLPNSSKLLARTILNETSLQLQSNANYNFFYLT